MKIPAISHVSPSLRFDQEARVVVVEYRNAETGKVARQIPSEEALRRAETEAEGAGPPSVAAKENEGAGAGATPQHQPEAAASTDEPAASASPRISIEV